MIAAQSNPIILVADVGGTKTDIALSVFQGKPTSGQLHHQVRFSNDDFSSPEELFSAYLKTAPIKPEYACLAIAGPIINTETKKRISHLTNRQWSFDADYFEQRFHLHKMVMINDLTALAYATLSMDNKELFCIQHGYKNNKKPCAIIAPGTGLGEGFVCHNMLGQMPLAYGSEGGHSDFAATNQTQAQLLTWAQHEMDHVSYEAFLCGSGIYRLYRFVVEELQITPSPEIAKAVCLLDNDPAAIITSAAISKSCKACQQSVELFCEILGSEAGNLALKVLAQGGVYIGGGILPRLYRHFSFDSFLSAFCNKGKMSVLMRDIPIYLMLSKGSNLRGAAYYANCYVA